MKQTILVPTDFSENAAVAFQFAWHIAQEFGFRICLLHVYEMPVLERFLVEEEISSLTDEKVRKTFETFVTVTAGIDSHAEGPEMEFILKEGHVVNEICKMAKNLNPLMVIVGAQGSGSDHYEELWTGGTTQKLIRKLNAPLMIVPPKAVFRPIRSIAFGTDFNSEDFELIAQLFPFAKALNASLTAVHIRQDPNHLDEYSLKYMKKVFATQVDEGNLTVQMLDNADVAEGLINFIGANGVSLLVLLRERTNILERIFDRSKSVQIAFRASIPTLIFRETD